MFNTASNHHQIIPPHGESHDFYDCPNCWGYSQWEDRDCIGSISIDKGSSLEIFSRNGFIRRFIKKYIG